jgi:hypothetical protein
MDIAMENSIFSMDIITNGKGEGKNNRSTSCQWNSNLTQKIQVITRSKNLHNGKMCKDKWNCLNGNYKNITNYHKGLGHNISY